MLDNIKHIFVVYNPGYAGNFLIRLLSLDTQVVPQITKELINTEKFFDLSNTERADLYSFSSVRTQFLNWQKFHRSWLDFHHYELFENRLKNYQQYTNIIFGMHSPEYLRFQDQISCIENYQVVFVDLDQTLYGDWIEKSQKDLNFKYRLDEKQIYEQMVSDTGNAVNIDLTEILESTEGFIREYIRVSNILGLETHIDSAKKLYTEWYETRVSFYL